MVIMGPLGGGGLCLACDGTEDRSDERPACLDVCVAWEGIGCLAKDSDELVEADKPDCFEKSRDWDSFSADCVSGTEGDSV